MTVLSAEKDPYGYVNPGERVPVGLNALITRPLLRMNWMGVRGLLCKREAHLSLSLSLSSELSRHF